MQKKVLVTGGNGFIGSHLVDALVKLNGYRVTVIDIAPRSFLFPLCEEVEQIQGNLNDVVRLSNVLADRAIDTVFHLAWATIPEMSIRDPMSELRENLVATVNLLEASKNSGVRRFIFLSSGGTVYGVPEYQPVPEEHPKNPINGYGIAKLTVEKYLHLYYRLHGLEYIVFRPSVPFGPRQNFYRKQGAVTVFIHNAVIGKPITIWGNGEIGRDFFYIDDLVDAMVRGLDFPAEASFVFNLGGKQIVTLSELVDQVQNVLGVKVKVIYEAGRSFDVPQIKLDCRKALEKLQWEPQVKLSDGIRRTADWIKWAAGR